MTVLNTYILLTCDFGLSNSLSNMWRISFTFITVVVVGLYTLSDLKSMGSMQIWWILYASEITNLHYVLIMLSTQKCDLIPVFDISTWQSYRINIDHHYHYHPKNTRCCRFYKKVFHSFVHYIINSALDTMR